jgi:hypothetical protein
MDEFVSIAIWFFMGFLLINTIMFWFQDTSIYPELGGVQGITQATGFNDPSQENNLTFFFIEVDCSAVQATDPAFGPCFLQRALQTFNEFVGMIFNFLTGWVRLLNQIIPSWLPGADLFKAIAIPIFSIIQFFSFFVIVLRVAGIIRGGS